MRRIIVLKAREVLRLNRAGLSLRDIAQALACGKTTVSEVLGRAEAAKISWPIDISDKELMSLLYPPALKPLVFPEPDMEYIFYEMKKKSVTLMLLWEEYKERHPQGLMYSQFCSHYRDFKKANRLTMHIEHKAGEEMQVDWAGYTVPYVDRLTGEIRAAYIFVAVLPASAYPFVYAYADRKLANWIDAHVKAFEYFGGVASVIVPDNLKTAVITPDATEPELNRSYNDMANHYGAAIVPARSGKAKDKAADENMVGNASRRILAPLRNVKFFSVNEINQAVREQLLKFISRPFQKMEGNRATAFEKIDKPALMPLPAQRYEYCDWKNTRVAYNYHVEYEKFYYSVPYDYAGSPCFVRATKDVIEVFADNVRIAAHRRNYNKAKRYTTKPEHMAESHRVVSGWSSQRFTSWAESIGEYTGQFVKKVLAASDYPIQSYRSCMAIMSHAKNTPAQIMENAARAALDLEIYSYKYFKMLIKKEGAMKEKTKPERIILNSNLRGKNAYAGGGMNA
jgi:transposase